MEELNLDVREVRAYIVRKSFQDILCELIAAKIAGSPAITAETFLGKEYPYADYVELAKKIYNQQEP